MEAACVRNVGVNAFFKGQFCIAAHVVTLPVSCSGGTFAPVFFHVAAVDVYFVCRAFVETSEVSAQHDKVCTHSQCQCHVVVVNDTAVGADGDIDACCSVVFISCLCYFDNCGSLTTADTFLFSCDTDGAAADTNFNEVRATFSQETEAFCVYNVTSADFHGVAVCFSYPVQSHFLPFGITFGGVDAQDVNACFYQCGHTFFVVTSVDTSAYHITFLCVQQFVFVFFMAVVVFTEYQILQSAFIVYDGQLIDLVVPDDVVCFFQCCASRGINQLIQRSHEVFYFHVFVQTAHTVVSACYHTYQFALSGTICGNSYCGVTCSFFQVQDILQCAFGADVGITDHETSFVSLCSCHHGCLAFDGLRAENEGNAAFFCQSHCHFVVRYCLHNSGNQWNVHGQSGFFPFFEFYHGCFQTHAIYHTFFGRIPGYQQVFAESSGRFCKVSCHFLLSFSNTG